ncbi:PLD nuclease N-terminal domain-containing protein [Actinoallomurus rhizosphaericola]|uniref:PLD nuclease N-terminal domain-containing protein n=1 Tax=Actinoallomurus rhizosphaericola TaxID=2952536 RepID=UPI002090A801|nr:PLD nuclease N-terminal domain-containing protein [Actinoallomurus rhizosphaericola]MCO5994525.1 PLD nuclease N-terminal domain-containing protein [Actinoallomurus rhizosphaericola]
MLVLAVVLVLVALGVWLFCLFEVLSTDETETRHLPKFAWFLIVLLGFELGAIAWLLFGRRRRFVTAGVTAWPPEFLTSREFGRDDPGPADRRGPLGPDDDPEFLRQLDRRLRGEES